MKLSQMDYDRLEIECSHENKGIFSRVTYFDPVNQVYIKEWGKDYFYKKYFQRTLNRITQHDCQEVENFFDHISLLYDILGDETDCDGYITRKGIPITWQNIDWRKYHFLIDRVVKRSFEFRIVYLDFTIQNVVEYEGNYYLIDLEPAIPVEFLKEIQNLDHCLQYMDYRYTRKIFPLLGIPERRIWTLKQQTYHDKPVNYGTANGRIWLEREFLPSLEGTVLFVGVNYYTDFYCKLVKDPEKFETIEINPELIEHGSPYTHHVGDIRDMKGQYDHVIFFGILGHPDDWDILKSDEDIYICFFALSNLVKPGGTLLFGPATVTRKPEFWQSIADKFKENGWEEFFQKQIDINYIWHGRKPE